MHDCTMMVSPSHVTLRPATVADADVLFHLMQLYYFEASTWSGEDLSAKGLYDCSRVDVQASLAQDPDWARLLWIGDALCGFVLVDEVEFRGARICELADLFIVPKYRRKGFAGQVVSALVRPGAGQWLLATFRQDHQAYAFWTRNLPRMGLEVEMLADATDSDFRMFLISAR